MDTNRFTSTGGGLRTVFAHWDQNPAGHNRNSTDFTKQATCNNESLPRKNEHKEWTCSSFGSFRGSIHPDRFAILAVLFTFKWSGHWSRPLKTAYLLLGFNHNYGEKNENYTCVNGLSRNLPQLWNMFHVQVAYRWFTHCIFVQKHVCRWFSYFDGNVCRWFTIIYMYIHTQKYLIYIYYKYTIYIYIYHTHIEYIYIYIYCLYLTDYIYI